MNRWKAIVSPQTVNLLSSRQVQTSSLLARGGHQDQHQHQGQGQHQGGRGHNKANFWLTLGTATAATAVAFKLFQEKDR